MVRRRRLKPMRRPMRWKLMLVASAAGMLLTGCGSRPYRVFAVQVATAAPTGSSPEVPAAGLRPVGFALPGPPAWAGGKDASGTPWDLNQVSEVALETLPGMDAATAAAIIAHRPYRGKRELLTKHVVTAAQYARWKGALVVHRSGGRPAVPRQPSPSSAAVRQGAARQGAAPQGAGRQAAGPH